jgi:2,3-dihydroxybenzoate-AMP ligase
MLDGVVPFPPDFAARYRAKGYWRDRALRDEFADVFARHADRIAVIDGDRRATYAEIDRTSTNLALNLLELGLAPLDRVVVQLPNVLEFVQLYFALQKIGCIPIAALASHRFREVSQFASLSGAVACVAPDRQRDFSFAPMLERIRAEAPSVRHTIILGEAPAGAVPLRDLIERPSRRAPGELATIRIAPTDPAAFQLSGGTTGIPKLIPRAHNDYAYNSKTAAAMTELGGDGVLLLVLPIAHNLPLACPGVQGAFLNGARVVLGGSARAADVFRLIEEHRVTHIPLVPTLLIDWINDPAIRGRDLSSIRIIQSGGQRLQPQIKLKVRELFPNAFMQENFGMAEGVLMFVRRDDPEEAQLETAGRPMCPDDEIRLVDDEDRIVAPGEVGEMCCRGPYTLRGYFGVPDYNARAFTSDGFYRSGDLMRQHPSGNYVVEGRKKDLINRGGEKISAEEIENLILAHPAVVNVACVPYPDPRLGERMCACVILRPGARLTLPALVDFLERQEIARHKLPERLEIMREFPVSTFGKVSKKSLVESLARAAASA